MEIQIPYTLLGSGPRILLAFHGIGQDGASCFAPSLQSLGSHYTIYAFDLPFHGANGDAPFEVITKTDWKECIQSFLSQNNVTRFDITGFSIGGRFALATLQAFPQNIDNAFLIAPDGRIALAYYGRTIDDHVSIDTVESWLQTARAT